MAYFFEVGLLLIVLPWSQFWEHNYFAQSWPLLAPLVTNSFVRGGVTGLGFVNLLAGVAERRAERQRGAGRDVVDDLEHRGPLVADVVVQRAQLDPRQPGLGRRDVAGGGRRGDALDAVRDHADADRLAADPEHVLDAVDAQRGDAFREHRSGVHPGTDDRRDPGDGGVLSADQYAKLRAEIDESFAGAMNAGRPMLLDGGLKWQAMSLSPADMDFVGLKAQAAREIALAFGVPPMLLGLPGDNAYANYREANRALWRQAIVPMGERILGAVAQGLTPWLGEVSLAIDLNRVPVLAEERERLWRQVAAANFLSDGEKRAMLGFGEG